VHELVGGRAAWTALGLPTDGAVGDRRRISHYVAEVPTLGVQSTIADLVALDEQRWPTPVVNDDGVLVGAVHPTASTLPSSTPIEGVMVPAPGTIRPELRIDEVLEQLKRDGLDHVFVTAVDGVLLGLVVTQELHA
jgi:Mg/Co/Ni transporter MgtE